MAQRPLDRWLGALARVGLGLWIGAVVGIAFVAAPLVFGAVPEHLVDKDSAARVIGPAFARVDVLGLVAGAIALLHVLRQPRSRSRRVRGFVLGGMMAAAAVNAWILAPAITARTEPLGTYHLAATILWMGILLGGSGLLMWEPTPRLCENAQSAGP